MGKKEKLIARLKSAPKDFTFDEMINLLELLEFEISNKGRTSGSRVQFKKGDIPINLHKPHLRKELLEYQIKYVLEALEREGLL
ncbi:MAG: type II toxin-antitoxin system HicA family toxin [Clostridiales bacterium]|nr:type II toxin-antitoxin system HicA family toxin [Clostridiales bacterium]